MLDRIKGLLGIGAAPPAVTPGKRPRKVALVHVKDCCRATHKAYWQITVLGSEAEGGFRWQAKLMSYEPVAWDHRGKVTKERPRHAAPVYPSDAHLMRDAEFRRLEELARTGTEEEAAVAKARIAQALAEQDAYRAECRRIYEAHPKPVYLIDEQTGFADSKDDADTAAQEWVRSRMKDQRRPGAHAVAGYAIPLPLEPLGALLGDLFDELRYRWRKHVAPLLALGINGTTRNNMLTQILNALDAGAGAALWRIYDGTRPATCGTATTLGAELTCSDPAGSVASQVLTFSAITADASANASITATWFRLVDSTGTCVHDGNVGTSGSDLNLNSTTITAGQEVSITSATITAGNP